ncbi:MAG: hypothetical protein WC234_04535 [Endomicrobiaceae bacterium]
MFNDLSCVSRELFSYGLITKVELAEYKAKLNSLEKLTELKLDYIEKETNLKLQKILILKDNLLFAQELVKKIKKLPDNQNKIKEKYLNILNKILNNTQLYLKENQNLLKNIGG